MGRGLELTLLVMALWSLSCGARADLILLPVPALSSCQDEYSVCCRAMSLHSMEYLLIALFPGKSLYLIIVLQVQTANIRQKWSLLVISLLLYFRDNFGIYKDSEVVAWHCTDASLVGAASLARKMCVKVPVLASYFRNTFFSSKVMYQSCCKVY